MRSKFGRSQPEGGSICRTLCLRFAAEGLNRPLRRGLTAPSASRPRSAWGLCARPLRGRPLGLRPPYRAPNTTPPLRGIIETKPVNPRTPTPRLTRLWPVALEARRASGGDLTSGQIVGLPGHSAPSRLPTVPIAPRSIWSARLSRACLQDEGGFGQWRALTGGVELPRLRRIFGLKASESEIRVFTHRSRCCARKEEPTSRIDMPMPLGSVLRVVARFFAARRRDLRGLTMKTPPRGCKHACGRGRKSQNMLDVSYHIAYHICTDTKCMIRIH